VPDLANDTTCLAAHRARQSRVKVRAVSHTAYEPPEPNTPVTLGLDCLLGFMLMVTAMGFFYDDIGGIWFKPIRFVVGLAGVIAPLAVLLSIAGIGVAITLLLQPNEWPKGLSLLAGFVLGFVPYAKRAGRDVRARRRGATKS
jgi:hypothetical protein